MTDAEPDGSLPARLRALLTGLGGDGRRRAKAAARGGQGDADLVLAEGPHLVEEAVRAGLTVVAVVATEEGRTGAAGEAVAALAHRGVPVHTVAARAFAGLAATRAPQGVLAVVRLPSPPPLAGAWAGEGLVLGLDAVQDPGNVGALARTARAAGAAMVALGRGSARPDDAKTLRASQGALFFVPAWRGDLAEAVAAARAAGARVAATAPRGGVAPWRADLRGPVLLLLGGEGAGLAPALAEAADLRLTLPMAAGESLGVAAAGAVVLYERVRQHAGAGGGGA